MMLTRPAASTLSTGSAATSRISPGSAEKASASSPATRFNPARLPVPLLIAAHFSTYGSIGASAARSIAAFSVAVRLVIARLSRATRGVCTPARHFVGALLLITPADAPIGTERQRLHPRYTPIPES